MLSVSSNPRGVAVTPLRVDLILDLMMHILQGAYRKSININSRLFKHFACSSNPEILIEGIDTASHRLPEIGFIGPLY
jgi:hypothetical protein